MRISELKNISLDIYEQEILDDVSFNINKSERTSINGPSGSGKSTILRIIARLTKQDSGIVEFNGKDITNIEYTEYRRDVSYVMQNLNSLEIPLKKISSFHQK